MIELGGQQLGNYSLIKRIGSGGSADVYLGKQIYLETFVAVKVLHATLKPEDTEKFRLEAKTVAHLRHPHIVKVLDFGVQRRTPYLIMEYAPEGTLHHRYPLGTRLPPREILSYVEQVASALQYAHDQHLVHRDIKPDNMLIGEKGEILLSDFGIVIPTQSVVLGNDARGKAGTLHYMAPEQFNGYPRRASDQYSLGIVVYRWLTGESPFTGTPIEISVKHQTVMPEPPSKKVPGLSPTIDEVVLKALEKDPKNRYPNIQAFAQAFAKACTDSPIKSGRPALTYTGHTGWVNALSWSPDGVYIASGGQDRSVQVWDARSGTLTLTYTGHTSWVTSAAWSPDGSRIASAGDWDNTVVQAWDASSGKLTLTYTGHTKMVTSVAWSPDGTRIASGGEDNTMQVWDARSGKRIATYKHRVALVSWSPDGSCIAAAGDWDNTVQVWDARSGKLTLTYTGHTTRVFAVAWSPDGSRIASGGKDRTVQVWDARGGKRTLTYTGHIDCIQSVAWSPDGSRIASGGWDRTVQVWDARGGKHIATHSGHSTQVFAVAWSPDGTRIASGGLDCTVQVWDAP